MGASEQRTVGRAVNATIRRCGASLRIRFANGTLVLTRLSTVYALDSRRKILYKGSSFYAALELAENTAARESTETRGLELSMNASIQHRGINLEIKFANGTLVRVYRSVVRATDARNDLLYEGASCHEAITLALQIADEPKIAEHIATRETIVNDFFDFVEREIEERAKDKKLRGKTL